MAFDLLDVRGRRITGQPLTERRQRLIDLVGRLSHPLVIAPDYIVGKRFLSGKDILAVAAAEHYQWRERIWDNGDIMEMCHPWHCGPPFCLSCFVYHTINSNPGGLNVKPLSHRTLSLIVMPFGTAPHCRQLPCCTSHINPHSPIRAANRMNGRIHCTNHKRSRPFVPKIQK